MNYLLTLLNRLNELGNWVRSSSGDTATVLLVLGHPDVTLVTPGGVPGVLDDPVVAGWVVLVTDGENTMVESGGGAESVVVDTLLVESEGEEVSVDGDRDWADSGDGGLEVGIAALGDIVALGEGGGSGHIRLARSILGPEKR